MITLLAFLIAAPALAQYSVSADSAAVVATTATATLIVRPSLVIAKPDLRMNALEPGFDGGKKRSGGEWYVSWGYNKDVWAPVDIRVSQPGLGNDVTFHDVKAHDEPPWKTGLWNKGDLTYSQYNFRVGRFIGKKRALAVEYSHDHAKYTSTLGQTARVSGMVDGKPFDGPMTLDNETFDYRLHNGANFETINIVKRLPLVGRPNDRYSLSGIAKAGVGLVVTHAENKVFGSELDPGPKTSGHLFGRHAGWWQFDGWTAGLEAGVRFVPLKPFYLELTDKLAYGRMKDVPVHQGTARHDLWVNQLILSLGVAINGAR